MDTLASASSHAQSNCVSCGYAVIPGGKFCTNCGAKIVMVVANLPDLVASVLVDNPSYDEYGNALTGQEQEYEYASHPQYYEPTYTEDQSLQVEGYQAYIPSVTAQTQAQGGRIPRQGDLLGRDRGHCIFSFGTGGKVFFSLPSRRTVYTTAGVGVPTAEEKAYPGYLQTNQIDRFLDPILFEGLRGTQALIKLKKPQLIAELTKIGGNTDFSGRKCMVIEYLSLLIHSNFGKLDASSTLKLVRNLIPNKAAVGITIGERIEDHLLGGHLYDACYLALSANMWSEALVMASRINQTVYTDVLFNFAKDGMGRGMSEAVDSSFVLKVLFFIYSGNPASNGMF
jgi:hypothetical protein